MLDIPCLSIHVFRKILKSELGNSTRFQYWNNLYIFSIEVDLSDDLLPECG